MLTSDKAFNTVPGNPFSVLKHEFDGDVKIIEDSRDGSDGSDESTISQADGYDMFHGDCNFINMGWNIMQL